MCSFVLFCPCLAVDLTQSPVARAKNCARLLREDKRRVLPYRRQEWSHCGDMKPVLSDMYIRSDRQDTLLYLLEIMKNEMLHTYRTQLAHIRHMNICSKTSYQRLAPPRIITRTLETVFFSAALECYHLHGAARHKVDTHVFEHPCLVYTCMCTYT